MTDEVIDEPVNEPEPQLTVADLSLTKATSITKPVLTLAQYVEPLRDGADWCTPEDAEEMLVKTAKASMRGMGGLKATKYAISFDAATNIMTLVLG